MRSLTFTKSLQILLAVATVVVGLASAESASAQPYYYQPAPDYYHNDTASGTFLGGALGAITGAAVAGRKDRGAGALIGAGVGAVTGNLLGRSKDATDERRAANGAMAVGQMNQQAVAMAVTDTDLVQMTRAGISEDVIISTMRSRGTRIDLSPQSLIGLRQQGVSDRVVLAAQQMSGSGYAPGAPAYGPTVVSEIPPPPAVIVAPYRPYPYYYPRPYYYGHYHHHHHHPHTSVRIGF